MLEATRSLTVAQMQVMLEDLVQDLGDLLHGQGPKSGPKYLQCTMPSHLYKERQHYRQTYLSDLVILYLLHPERAALPAPLISSPEVCAVKAAHSLRIFASMRRGLKQDWLEIEFHLSHWEEPKAESLWEECVAEGPTPEVNILSLEARVSALERHAMHAARVAEAAAKRVPDQQDPRHDPESDLRYNDLSAPMPNRY